MFRNSGGKGESLIDRGWSQCNFCCCIVWRNREFGGQWRTATETAGNAWPCESHPHFIKECDYTCFNTVVGRQKCHRGAVFYIDSVNSVQAEAKRKSRRRLRKIVCLHVSWNYGLSYTFADLHDSNFIYSSREEESEDLTDVIFCVSDNLGSQQMQYEWRMTAAFLGEQIIVS